MLAALPLELIEKFVIHGQFSGDFLAFLGTIESGPSVTRTLAHLRLL